MSVAQNGLGLGCQFLCMSFYMLYGVYFSLCHSGAFLSLFDLLGGTREVWESVGSTVM